MDIRNYGDVRSALESGKINCVQLVDWYLKSIESKKHLNAFIEVFADSAFTQAKLIDKEISNKKWRKLSGCVIAIKDNICYKGHHVSASSKILDKFESLFTSTALQRLIDEGAIVIGRTNCDEFAMGSSNETSYFGKALNPLNEKCVPGGSSGGSCAAVAASLCTVALGSDTGGSIRQPGSFCGLVGFKPTYGRISRYGLLAYASSFDQIGPITTTVEDAALLTQVMWGKDENDSTSSSHETESLYPIALTEKKLRIAYLKECIDSPGLDLEIKNKFNATLTKLTSLGHTITAVEFPYLDYLVPAYYVLTTAEASSNLARYAGVHYGYSAKDATDVDSTYVNSRTLGFGTEVKRRIMLGTFVLSAGFYDAYYTKGLKVRRLIKEKTEAIFTEYDFILTPTTPGTAFEFGANAGDPVKMYLEDIFTVQANLAGIPAITIPLGTHNNQLPFGLQIMGKAFDEKALFEFAAKCDKVIR